MLSSSNESVHWKYLMFWSESLYILWRRCNTYTITHCAFSDSKLQETFSTLNDIVKLSGTPLPSWYINVAMKVQIHICFTTISWFHDSIASSLQEIIEPNNYDSIVHSSVFYSKWQVLFHFLTCFVNWQYVQWPKYIQAFQVAQITSFFVKIPEIEITLTLIIVTLWAISFEIILCDFLTFIEWNFADIYSLQ